MGRTIVRALHGCDDPIAGRRPGGLRTDPASGKVTINSFLRAPNQMTDGQSDFGPVELDDPPSPPVSFSRVNPDGSFLIRTCPSLVQSTSAFATSRSMALRSAFAVTP